MITVNMFTAPWCQPCKQARPVVESFAESNGFEFSVYDAEEDTDIFLGLGIRSIPTVVIEEHGQELMRLTSAPEVMGIAHIFEGTRG